MTTREFRTEEQYEEILDSVYNGNWTVAGEEVVQFRFSVHDLIRIHKEREMNGMYTFEDPTDIAVLAEMAMRVRMKLGLVME